LPGGGGVSADDGGIFDRERRLDRTPTKASHLIVGSHDLFIELDCSVARSRAPARFGQAIGPGVGVRPLSIKLMKGFNGNAAIEKQHPSHSSARVQ